MEYQKWRAAQNPQKIRAEIRKKKHIAIFGQMCYNFLILVEIVIIFI